MGGGDGEARFLDTALFSNSSAARRSNLVGSLFRGCESSGGGGWESSRCVKENKKQNQMTFSC